MTSDKSVSASGLLFCLLSSLSELVTLIVFALSLTGTLDGLSKGVESSILAAVTS